MKPIIMVLGLLMIVSTISACQSTSTCAPEGCYQNYYRRHYVKVNYEQPVVYCEYHNDARGVLYRICSDCTSKRCVKEYFFDNYCGNNCVN